MATHQIVAIRKPNHYSSHEHITHVKYDWAVHTREEVIRLINAGTDRFYVSVGGATAYVEVVKPPFPHSPYIRTYPDRTGKDNLLALPDC